ncbi:hypothetical protein [Streptomyces sp. SID3343]|uniref:hypothetical protein n=1 Tax=Streptomyces sp. SID3343 TaxID=2690260 RepID=UPI00136F85B5|nr:hypothetical protein [Streptomyces sp. SID3343]MYV97258.1 hypothetical protein [Streptomyces sp. SID3343]
MSGNMDVTVGDLKGLPDGGGLSPAHVEGLVAGLVFNRSADGTVVERILSLDPVPRIGEWLTRVPLPGAAGDAVAAHPNPRVREYATKNPHLGVEVLTRLMGDTDTDVRIGAIRAFRERGETLPDGWPERLADDPDAGIRAQAAAPDLPTAVRLRLAADPDPLVRRFAILRPGLWEYMDAGLRASLAADPVPRVRSALQLVRRGAWLPRSLTDYEAETDVRRSRGATERGELGRDLAEALVRSDDVETRTRVAGNPHLPTELALVLGEDADAGVRLAVSVRQDLTEAQRAAIDHPTGPGRFLALSWVAEQAERDPASARRTASSGHVLLRRATAGVRRLPADVVELLARDEDYQVRYTLAQECDDAPHKLIIAVYAADRDEFWGMLTRRPNFARPGLERFAEDPDSRLRNAALFDPDIEPGLVTPSQGDGPFPQVRGTLLLDVAFVFRYVVPFRALRVVPKWSPGRGSSVAPNLTVCSRRRTVSAVGESGTAEARPSLCRGAMRRDRVHPSVRCGILRVCAAAVRQHMEPYSRRVDVRSV